MTEPRRYGARGAFASLLLAHGAGAGQDHPFMVGMAERLAARGVTVVTFDFPYMAEGKKLPDRAPVLEAAFTAAGGAVRGPRPLFVGGKSMGGRVASQVLAKAGLPRAVGAVFLGYPLHPPGKPETRRDAHLPDVGVPMLFVQGARDPFGTAREIRALARRLPDARVHVVAQGDHSLAVPKRAAVTGAAALDLAADAVASFMKEVVARGAKKAK